MALREVVIGTVNRFARGYMILGGLVLTAVVLVLTDLVVPETGFAIDGWGTWIGVKSLCGPPASRTARSTRSARRRAPEPGAGLLRLGRRRVLDLGDDLTRCDGRRRPQP